jgi:methyl-accepting chemotaxis protein
VINRVVANLSSGAAQMLQASAEVSSGSQRLAAGASEQASSLEETSASLEEVSSMTRDNTGASAVDAPRGDMQTLTPNEGPRVRDTELP